MADLLLRWEELFELGQDTSASELAHGHPYLVDELARRIHALKATSWLGEVGLFLLCHSHHSQ